MGGSANKDVHSNPEADDLVNRIMLELDVAERALLLKEAGLIILNDVVEIPLNLVTRKIYWWPWVKNYYGELTINDDATWAPVLKYVWLDQGLKKEMGF